MKLVDFKELMIRLLPLQGFEFDASIRGSVYLREDAEWKYIISIDNLSYGERMEITCNGGSLINKEVEAIFSKIAVRYRLNLSKVNVTFTDYHQYELTDTRNKPIITEEDLSEVAGIWEKEIRLYVQPFLGSWNDLTRIDRELLNNVPPSELPNYLPGETVFKKLIIMKLAGDPSYGNYLLERENALKKAVREGKEQYRPNLEALLELKALLG